MASIKLKSGPTYMNRAQWSMHFWKALCTGFQNTKTAIIGIKGIEPKILNESQKMCLHLWHAWTILPATPLEGRTAPNFVWSEEIPSWQFQAY